MKPAKIVRTVKSGGLQIEIRKYADGRFGFDVEKPDRRKIRASTLDTAVEKALAHLSDGTAGKLASLDITAADLEEFLRGRAAKRAKTSTAELADRFLASKEGKGRSAIHIRSLRQSLTTFSKAFPGEIQGLTRIGVESWLNERGVGPRRWNNILSNIVALMRFARREGAIGADLAPVEMIERRAVTTKVLIYTPDELQRLLAVVAPQWLPVLALGAFAGIRPEELAPEYRTEKPGLRWENILWHRNVIDIPAEVSKTRRRRHIPINDALRAWIGPIAQKSGPIAPKVGRLSNWTGGWRKASGVEWKSDALRHSYAGYRLALTHDMAALALEMGNSPAMIFRHYLELSFREVAEQWFALRPKSSKSSIRESLIATKRVGGRAKSPT